MDNKVLAKDRLIVIVGAAGFVGGRLSKALAERGYRLRLADRNTDKTGVLADKYPNVEAVRADLLDAATLGPLLDGAHAAFYLVHSMGGRTLTVDREFISRDKLAAENFVKAADGAGLERIIYLGGLGETGKGLSEHLSSRTEVAKILGSGKAKTTVLRAAVIIGAGGASFEILRYLVERLPVMICPRWINTRIQPIAVNDVIAYLTGCLENPDTAGKRFDIGGPEVMTYRMMMDEYAAARGLARRIIITVPVLTPSLSAYWVDLVSPVPSGVAHPLIEGMKNEVVCRDDSIDRFVKITKTPFREAVKIAVAEETSGPGVSGF